MAPVCPTVAFPACWTRVGAGAGTTTRHGGHHVTRDAQGGCRCRRAEDQRRGGRHRTGPSPDRICPACGGDAGQPERRRGAGAGRELGHRRVGVHRDASGLADRMSSAADHLQATDEVVVGRVPADGEWRNDHGRPAAELGPGCDRDECGGPERRPQGAGRPPGRDGRRLAAGELAGRGRDGGRGLPRHDLRPARRPRGRGVARRGGARRRSGVDQVGAGLGALGEVHDRGRGLAARGERRQRPGLRACVVGRPRADSWAPSRRSSTRPG